MNIIDRLNEIRASCDGIDYAYIRYMVDDLIRDLGGKDTVSCPDKPDLRQLLVANRTILRNELHEAEVNTERARARLLLINQLLFECDPEAKYDDDVQS